MKKLNIKLKISFKALNLKKLIFKLQGARPGGWASPVSANGPYGAAEVPEAVTHCRMGHSLFDETSSLRMQQAVNPVRPGREQP